MIAQKTRPTPALRDETDPANRNTLTHEAQSTIDAHHRDRKHVPDRRRPMAPVPSAPKVDEIHLPGFRLAFGYSSAERSRTSMRVLILSDETLGLAVFSPSEPVANSNVKSALADTFSTSLAPLQACARFLRALESRCDLNYLFLGIWQDRQQFLAYGTVGLEPAVAVNPGWPHQLQDTITISKYREHRQIICGAHFLSAGERWLLHTKVLVDVPDPTTQPFNSVGLIQYAYDDRAMRDALWVKYLLGRGALAHNGVLPEGSAIVSLECERR